MSTSKPFTPNPVLKDLQALVGNWDMELSNASFLPDPSMTVPSHASIQWIEDGAYLVICQGERNSDLGFAIWTIGRDEAVSDYTALYYDNRSVSRIYVMSFLEGVWRMWRDSPGFCQRFKGVISQDGRRIEASWEKSPDGKSWSHDFDITYRRRDETPRPTVAA